MSNLDGALAEAAEVLEACSIPYVLIGGLAVAAWGEPRSTLDVPLSQVAFVNRPTSAVRRTVKSVASRIAREFVWISFSACCRSNAKLSYALWSSQSGAE